MNLNATLIAQVLVFGILVWFTLKYVWPPIAKALDERADKIAEGLAAAERGKSDFEQAEKKVAELLADGRNQATELVEEAKNQASVEAARIAAQAKSDVEQETNRAREALREQVAALAVKGAEAILRSEVNAAKHADLLANLKQEL